LSSQPRFDKHIELGTQFAYRNAVANSICLSKRGWEHNLLIETRFGGSGGGCCQKERERERIKRRERQERRERRGERGEQPRFDKHIEFATAFRSAHWVRSRVSISKLSSELNVLIKKWLRTQCAYRNAVANPYEYYQSPRVLEFLQISHVSQCFSMVCAGFQRPGLLLSSPRGPDSGDPVATLKSPGS
jgi:hypothetical protein